MRLVRVLCCALAITAWLAPGVRADEWNKQTILTFSGPVQVPGVTLPAGTYQFKLADLQSNRHVVQIFDKDGTKLYTTILAIPNQRLEPTDKPVVMFGETPAGTPSAVKAWFYPGDTIGDEFVYPRREAVAIAKATHQPVLSRADESKDMKTGEVARVDENGNKVKGEESEKSAAAQNPKPAAPTTTAGAATTTAGTSGSAAATTTAPEQPAKPRAQRPQNAQTGTTGTTGTANRSTLPRTASPLALYELMSGLAFAGAFGIGQLRRRLR